MEHIEQKTKLDKQPKEPKNKPEKKQRGRPTTTKAPKIKIIKEIKLNYSKPTFYLLFDDN